MFVFTRPVLELAPAGPNPPPDSHILVPINPPVPSAGVEAAPPGCILPAALPSGAEFDFFPGCDLDTDGAHWKSGVKIKAHFRK